MEPVTHTCLQCGATFAAVNPRRVFCCERCRRTNQDERRKRERAECARAKAKRIRAARDPVARATCPFLFAYGEEYQDCTGCMECFMCAFCPDGTKKRT